MTTDQSDQEEVRVNGMLITAITRQSKQVTNKMIDAHDQRALLI